MSVSNEQMFATIDGMKGCPKCQRWLEVSAFSKNRSRPDGLQVSCTECQRAYVRQHYARNLQYYLDKAARRNRLHSRAMTVELRRLKDVPCADCGKRFPPCAMDFDHVRGEKLFNVGEGVRFTLSVILAEAAKCEVVCANCHRIRTFPATGRP